jgi:23S rRNA (cytidine2498-2'-O)-methyltransferase
VVNLKFGRLDPLPLLRKARAAFPGARCLHLYHDRDEFTVLL